LKCPYIFGGKFKFPYKIFSRQEFQKKSRMTIAEILEKVQSGVSYSGEMLTDFTFSTLVL
jgi:hypothetical protein